MNKYLVKVAETKEKQKKTFLQENGKALGAAGVVGGISTARKQYHSGNLTGRETLFHGSSEETIAKVKKEGLKPNKGHTGVSSKVPGLTEKNKDLVFTTRDKVQAHQYGAQQTEISRGKIKTQEDLMHYQRTKAVPETAKSYLTNNKKRVAEINLPTWKKEHRGAWNPEVRQNIRARRAAPFAKFMDGMGSNERHAKTMFNVLQKPVHVNRGEKGIGTEYIKGSANYQKNSVKEIGQFIKHDTKRFAKGVGKTLGGIGMLGAGAYALKKGFEKTK